MMENIFLHLMQFHFPVLSSFRSKLQYRPVNSFNYRFIHFPPSFTFISFYVSLFFLFSFFVPLIMFCLKISSSLTYIICVRNTMMLLYSYFIFNRIISSHETTKQNEPNKRCQSITIVKIFSSQKKCTKTKPKQILAKLFLFSVKMWLPSLATFIVIVVSFIRFLTSSFLFFSFSLLLHHLLQNVQNIWGFSLLHNDDNRMLKNFRFQQRRNCNNKRKEQQFSNAFNATYLQSFWLCHRRQNWWRLAVHRSCRL